MFFFDIFCFVCFCVFVWFSFSFFVQGFEFALRSAACPSNASKIQKFTILNRDFSSSTNELTPTLKTKRSVVEQMNAATIEKMYASKDIYVPCED